MYVDHILMCSYITNSFQVIAKRWSEKWESVTPCTKPRTRTDVRKISTGIDCIQTLMYYTPLSGFKIIVAPEIRYVSLAVSLGITMFKMKQNR